MRTATQSALRHVHPRNTPFSFGSCCLFSRTATYLHNRPLSSASASPFSQQHLDDSDDQQHFHSHYHLKDADIQRIKLVASRAQTPLSIAQCIKLGESLSTKSLLKNLIFLNRELPVRFSKRILELDNLPEELKKTEPFMNLAQNYSSSFQALQEYSDNSRLWFLSPNTYHREEVELDDNEGMQTAVQKEYADLLQTVTNRHKQDVVFMAHGISLFKQYQQNRSRPSDEIQRFLNSFNRGRLGIRIMVGHHLALQSQLFHPTQPSFTSSLPTSKGPSPAMMGLAVSTTNSKRVGIIEPQCDIEALINNATQSAQFVFFQHYNTVFPPNVHIQHSKDIGGQRVRFPVVPALLHHILFELLKNSMRATAEFHGLDKMSYPDIEVQLSSDANGGLQIQIKDHGGGMPQEKLAHPFDYMFTTGSNTVCIDFPSILNAVEKKPQTSATSENLPLCGFGFGLATSKLYARLFGGDLTIQSIPGSGTEANIQLCRLEDQIEQVKD
ncbi:hypothetical protein BG006_010739 [Podila minutissima]|uniref:Protein-serine/threonine kinase n=1 Tax=Podila minutissima TaxID=64525 RepID=A0A9P5SQ98_9FUNG|nr:hypothetical protein BG006_010739 [Podila minutissima]